MNPTDPLAGLAPLREPPPVDWWPLAPGWWLLGFLLLCALSGLGVLVWRTWKRRAYRREALAQLEQLRAEYDSTGDGRRFASALNALLKSVALCTYDAERVAPLHGADWIGFLNAQVSTPLFAQEFADAPYRQGGELPSGDALYQKTRLWIKKHRGPQ